MQTGEIFKGPQADVLRKLAESNANTHIYARQQKTQAEQYQQELNRIQQALQPQQPQNNGPQIDPAAGVIADLLAPYMGFQNGEEMKDAIYGMRQTSEDVLAKNVVSTFFAQNPDFVSTPQNGTALYEYAENNGFDTANPQHLRAAHMLMKSGNAYPDGFGQQGTPIVREQPNPSLNGNFPAPSGQVTEEAASTMPLNELGALLGKMRRSPI